MMDDLAVARVFHLLGIVHCLPIRLSPTATRDSVRPSSWTFTSVTDPGAVQPRCARRQDDLRNGTAPPPPDNGQTSEPSPGRSPHRPTQSFTQEPGGTLHVGGVGKIRIGKVHWIGGVAAVTTIVLAHARRIQERNAVKRQSDRPRVYWNWHAGSAQSLGIQDNYTI
jgi:hypothetical protein